MSAATDLAAELSAMAADAGFVASAVTSAEPDFEARAIARERVAAGWFSGLPWFHDERMERATDPTKSLDGARSVLLLLANYRHADPSLETAPPVLRGRVARYAWGRDYHRILERRARPLLLRLRDAGHAARTMVDHGPLMERAFARRGGLGWQGKNTMLLRRGVGSYTLIAAILTDADLRASEAVAQHCGQCIRCLPSCPTGALRGSNELVSDLCIAHHTIENRGVVPRELRPHFGDWVFGCDLCQEACPVNGDASAGTADAMPEFAPADAEAARPELAALLDLDDNAFLERFAGRPIMRAKRIGMARNACIALGNSEDPGARAPLRKALVSEDVLVRGHAAWALGRLGDEAALAGATEEERDPWVRDEIAAARNERKGAT